MKSSIFLLAALVAPLAFAGSKGVKEKYQEAVKADTSAQFAEVVAGVRAQMVPGGRYEFVDSVEKATIDGNLASMQELFEENGGLVANMNHEEKVALFNAQEAVNAILTRRDSDRVICEHIKPIGSNIPKTTCHTYGQAEAARRQTIKQMKDWDHVPCVGPNWCKG